MEFHPKNFNFQIFLDLIHVYQYHTPLKNSLKNSIHNLNFEIYIQKFQTLWWVLFCHKYTSYIQNLQCLLNFSK